MISEKAIENFYHWEIKGRGYQLFPYPVNLEPTFRDFYHSFKNQEYVDDGKVTGLFGQIFQNRKHVATEETIEEKPPRAFEYTPFLKQFNIRFLSKQNFNDSLTLEFLNMLSESVGQISFEIIGKHNSIDIQIVCSIDDSRRIYNLINAYFPNSVIHDTDTNRFPFNTDTKLLIVDFGYDEEFMRPINTSINGLTSIVSTLDNLRHNEVVMLQIVFKGVQNSWANSILNSVCIGSNSFFQDSPEMLTCAKRKTSSPLFAVVFRIAVQSNTSWDAEKLANELILNIKTSSKSEFNTLIPLSNQGYSYESHLENLRLRGSNRFGMIMNSQEMFSFIHFLNISKQNNSDSKTKAVPPAMINNDYLIGINRHFGVEKEVTLNDEQRLRHCHIIGATGTGKSTLISNLFLEDVKKGNGCVIFDPHGDTIEEIIPHIPKDKLNDVILIDPSDSQYSFGFNLLSAKTEVEKIVLSSDLVDAFIRHSTSWGDQMTSVLSNAINTFLNSSKGGTLLDLKRFLLENSFRKDFLKSVDDRSIHYYWDNEYVLLKKGSISPLLTRLDTFLRPRIIRNILAQKEGLDFNEVINNRKILLVKLSQGLIGEENSYLLGTLILSKIYQVAQARQLLNKSDRYPFYIYLDEFHNFISPSINGILSGSRKYGVGLILAHQELNQIKDPNIYNSVLSNTNIRICFRLGDLDAKKLESGFSSFDSNDLQNLDTGEAIVKVGKNTDDFSIKTLPIFSEDTENDNRKIITENTRKKYSKKISEIEQEINNQIPHFVESNTAKVEEVKIQEEAIKEDKQDIGLKGKEYLESLKEQEEIREHRYLQTFVKKIAEQRGFKASIEEEVEGGRIDVVFIKDDVKIACEIAVSNSVEYEVKNVLKCKNSGYPNIIIISKDAKHLEKIKERALPELREIKAIYFITPDKLTEFLDSLTEKKEETRIRGYRVRVKYI